MNEPYVIWSFEHDAWWRPGGFGYTRELSEAGHFSKADADRIVADANRIRENEYALPLDDARHGRDRHVWSRLMAGAYDDNAGGLHLVPDELLTANGYADTPENRATLEAAARDAFGGFSTVEIDDEPAR